MPQAKARTICRVRLDRLLRILQRLRECHKFRVRRGSVCVRPRVRRQSLDSLRVALHRFGKFTRLEERIAFVPCLVAELWVDVRVLVLIELRLLNFAQLCENIWRPVLRERLFVEFDCICKVAFALVRAADAAQGFGDNLVVRADRAALFDSLFACRDALIIIALLKVGG